MSSGEEDYNEGESSSGLFQTLKKRRIQRACDMCRRKKIRCDGVQMPGNRCSNCIAYSFNCTYIEAAKKRGPPKGYVESLENRVERLDKLLRRLCPDETLYKELTGSIDNWAAENPPADPSCIVAHESQSPKRPPGSVTALESVTSAIRGMNSTPQSSQDLTDDDDDTTLLLADNMKRMQLEPHEYRFFGKSSGAMLIRTAMELKKEYTGKDTIPNDHSIPVLKNQRKEFWTIRPWEERPDFVTTPKYQFPDSDLAKHVIDCYFQHVNLYLPLLHRPRFEKLIEDGVHLTDTSFACVYLLVCAVGARYSDDDRVKLDGTDSLHSAGWKWFDQVQIAKKSLLAPPTLYDLQTYCLSVQFLQGSSAPQSCWTMVGIGIRLAQDVGAHRRKIPSHVMTAEDELWKRAFWVLVCMDRMISSSLGRPCAIQDEDFDLDLPVDCDDEYWDNEDPEQRFKQPPNKPSLVTAFILYLKLHQILAFSLRTIYSINKSKILLGFVGQQWEQHIVAELDSALNKWVDSVPDHLRWDPNREDDNFFNQSVTLYAAYYHIQILIHRPFIPSPSKPTPLSFPSLAICTNAARSCSHVVYIQKKRNPTTIPQIQMSVFTSGIVLLLSIWGGKRSGLSTDPNKEMADVHKCMEVLRNSENRWHSAGRLWDILYELTSAGDLPLPQAAPNGTNKRERDSETPMSAPHCLETLSSMAQPDGPRNIAGSRRVNKDASMSGQTSRPPQPQSIHVEYATPHQQAVPTTPSLQDSSMRRHSLSQVQGHVQGAPSMAPLPQSSPVECFALPVYSNELGRIPLHGQVTFSAQAQNQHPQPQQQQQPNYWFTGPAHDAGQASSSNTNAGNASMMTPQQRPQSGYSSMGEMSTMTQGYEIDAAALAAGMMFDTMAGTLGYGQQQSSFGIGPMDSSGSMAPQTMENSYRMTSMDTRGDLRNFGSMNPPNRAVGIEQTPDSMYPFVDNDTIAMWSNAPCGFELDEWGTYLNNVSELTQGVHGQSAGTSNSGGIPDHHRP